MEVCCSDMCLSSWAGGWTPCPVLGGTAQVLCPPLPSLVQVLHDYQRYRSNIREIGDLWVGVGTVFRQRGQAEGRIWAGILFPFVLGVTVEAEHQSV